MATSLPLLPSLLALSLACALPGVACAQASAPASGKAAPAKAAAAKKAPAKAVVYTPPPASAEQTEAAGRVYYGKYDCEFNQVVDIEADPKYPSYVDVEHLKTTYLMKPVVSSTGAVRLEDVHGETLMVQIANKSMLLNVKTGHRVVDDCESPNQHEFNAAAKAAQASGSAPAGGSMFSSNAK